MELTYTVVEEPARELFGISRDEYALCNYIQVWSSHPENRVPGYCDRTRDQMGQFIGMTDRGIRKMLARLTEIGLIQTSASGRYYRITKAWFEQVSLAKSRRKGEQSSAFENTEAEQSSGETGTKFRVKAEQSSGLGRNKVPPHKEYNKESHKEGNDIDIVVESDADFQEPGKKKKAPPVAAAPPEVEHIVNYLNHLAGTAYRLSKNTTSHINARLSEGYTVPDFELVISFKCSQWLHDPKMRQYLRPETLFSPKFDGYLNAAKIAIQNQDNDKHNGKSFNPADTINRAAALADRLRREKHARAGNAAGAAV